MALSIYCMSCGSPTFYTSLKPKFCSGCGKSYDESLASNKEDLTNKITSETNKIIEQILNKEKRVGGLLNNPRLSKGLEIDIDDDEQQTVPQIEGLDVEISVSKERGIKVQDLIFEHQTGLEPRPAGKKKSKKEFLDEWQREAGTRRKDTPPTEVGGSE